MMMSRHARAILATVHYNPETNIADQVDVDVKYGPKKARIHIDLTPTPIDDPNIPDETGRLLRELGQALRHISDVPLTRHMRHHLRN
jgi:hypothetical protein